MEQLVEPIQKRYGDDVEIVGVLWAQGGRDGRYEKAAGQYEQNLKKIIAAFRKDLGNPELPFILAHTVDAQGKGFPYMDQVRAAQERIAKTDPRSVLVSSEGLSTKRDNVHFDTKGQLELGRRFAKAYLELIEK
jgi:lysophospholipase L1-like esterase